ncbi:MAG: DNA polymerase I [Elusimicrobiota bacterium]
MTAQQRIYLVDAHAYLHRAYHALYGSQLRSSAGEPVWALFGFAKMLLAIIKKETPDYLAVCFDLPEPTFRHKKFKEYKATRKELDEDLIVQLGQAENMVRTMGLTTVAQPGYEADDLLATLARRAIEDGLDAVIVSGDKDALQLIGERVKVYNEAKEIFYDAEGVREKLKVAPEQVVDYLAIIGDTSDNVPGVPGIGPVGAVKLLNHFGTLAEAIEAAKQGHKDIKPKAAESLVKFAEAARLSQDLIRLDAQAPIKVKPRDCSPEVEPTPELIELFSRLGFKSILKSLGAVPASAEPPAPSVAGAGSAAAPAAILFKPVPPREMAAAAQTAPMVAVAVEHGAQPDLLTTANPQVGLALPDGRTAVFIDEDFVKHRGALAKIFGAGDVQKFGHDLKAVIRGLDGSGLELAPPLADTMLAAYCLDPSRPEYALEAVLAEAGLDLPPDEERSQALARRAAAVWALHKRFDPELRRTGLEKLYREFELPLLRVLAAMEIEGVAIDRAYLQRLAKEFAGEIARIKREVDKLAGVEINLGSPKQLVELLVDKLKLPVIHKTKKGGVSTDETALRAWSEQHPIPGKIIEYRELTKLKSTYIDALLEKADPETDRVHSHFNQAGTATGRLSSLDPNLQNIPVRTALGRRIRRGFIAGKGRALLAADYSQIDLRVLAHLSADPMLCGAFRGGEDVHLKTASEVFGLAPEDVSPEMRRRAKAVNFGIVYGQSAHGLSGELGIAHGQAKEYIDGYFQRYSGVAAWLKSNLDAARRDGCVKTLLGRIRYLPDINAKNFRERAFNERVAGNTPIQGTSADIIKAAMINIHTKMAESGKWKARLVLQVHDELIFELPQSEVVKFGAWVRREMETAIKLDVPVVVDVKSGPNWNEMKAVKL